VIIVFLLPSQKTGGERHAGSGWIKDAAGAAQRGAGVPILSRGNQDRRAQARSFRAVKLGAPRLIEPARAGMG
jgi:hypothetical protein